MLTIDLDELKDKLKSIVGVIDSIEPIGNHNLKIRHILDGLKSIISNRTSFSTRC